MRKKRKTARVVCLALAATALASLSLAGSASAKLTGEYTKFEFCPWKEPTTAAKCIHSVTEGGEVVLGSKKVPIEKPVTLQGGITKPVENVSTFVAATNGVTLSKAAQNVPGGLAGIVPDASSPKLVKALIKFFFENKLTGVTSTLELAKPANEIKVSEFNLTLAEGVAMFLPVKAHLENPFLGKSCFVGSSGTPLKWNLTAGTTAPPKPNEPITGKTGKITFIDGGRILALNENTLVDNAWSAPSASGCGGILSFLVNPIVNLSSGLPSAAGKNSAVLKNSIRLATVGAVKRNDTLNP